MARTKRIVDEEVKGEMESIAQTWRQFRIDNALTQTFLAEICGISRRTIQNIETGTIIPQEGTIQKYEALKKKYEMGKKRKQKPKDEEEEYSF
jgi:DNA-binding XRE family transcriptional regulator